jgi:arabinosyltransferase
MMLHICLQFVKHLVDLDVYNFLVGAMDSTIGNSMVQRNIPCFAMYQSGTNHSGVGSDHLQWGGASFHKMVSWLAAEP